MGGGRGLRVEVGASAPDGRAAPGPHGPAQRALLRNGVPAVAERGGVRRFRARALRGGCGDGRGTGVFPRGAAAGVASRQGGRLPRGGGAGTPPRAGHGLSLRAGRLRGRRRGARAGGDGFPARPARLRPGARRSLPLEHLGRRQPRRLHQRGVPAARGRRRGRARRGRHPDRRRLAEGALRQLGQAQEGREGQLERLLARS